MSKKLRLSVLMALCLTVAALIGLILVVFEEQPGVMKYIFPIVVLPLIALFGLAIRIVYRDKPKPKKALVA